MFFLSALIFGAIITKREMLPCMWFGDSWTIHSCACAQPLSRVWLFVAAWTADCQASLPMEFSGHKYWSGLPFPPLGDLPNPRVESSSLTSPALAGEFFTTTATSGKPWFTITCTVLCTQSSTLPFLVNAQLPAHETIYVFLFMFIVSFMWSSINGFLAYF